MTQPGSCRRRIAAAVVSAAVTRVAHSGLDRVVAPRPGWQRTNYAGETTSLVSGPAVVAGLATGIGSAPGVSALVRARLIAATLMIGAVGWHDDTAGSADARGLRGHARALRQGRVTSGVVKVAGIAGSAVVATTSPPGERRASHRRRGTFVDAALVAGLANLVNLLDLRPGRALKVALAAAAAGTAHPRGGLAAPVLGASLAALPEDLAGRSMLGDCGANALGAVVGFLAVSAGSLRTRRLLLAATVALILASERYSFTEIIARNRVLDRVDRWGRPAGRIDTSPAEPW